MTSNTPTRRRKAWLVVSNAIMMLGWLRVWCWVVWLVFFSQTPEDAASTWAPLLQQRYYFSSQKNNIQSALQTALALSFLEVGNALLGVTRSNPAHVLLFAVIRWAVQAYIAPLLLLSPLYNEQQQSFHYCMAWQHVFTVACWSLGDSIRFACFFVDNLGSSSSSNGGGGLSTQAKYIRYTVGPLLFPLGFMGEMLLVFAAAAAVAAAASPVDKQARRMSLALYGAGLLWPVGFYPLYSQLLRQRRKFLQSMVGHSDNSSRTKID